MAILILTTGGTFDKEYDELTGALDFRSTHVPKMLELGRCRLEVRVRSWKLKDSLELSEDEREEIAVACRDAEERQIVVTHGTDTMIETGGVIARAIAGVGKTVVLTGAMIPFAFGSSDGLFNLGSALSFAQALPPGVYIAMNGRWFAWDDCRKNRDLGVFERLR
ncbi:MAG TPA: asparaginase domain-containing protein [Thermoanaerobaculia bacterium]|jgi:L-asparaginase